MVTNEKLEGIEEHESEENWIVLAVVVLISFIVSYLLDFFFEGIPLDFELSWLPEKITVSMLILHVVILLTSLYIIYFGIMEFLEERFLTVEFLMGFASLGALYLDLLFEALSVLFLYSLAEFFEGYIEDRARRTVEKMAKYMPDDATVLVNGNEKKVPIVEVKLGEIVVVRPGERIPLDGKVIEGTTHVDQSIVTGESVPVFKKKEDEVYAGSLNLNGVIKVEVTKEAKETLVAKIVELVLEARERKANLQKLVKRFARIYVPVIIVLAFLTATVMPIITASAFEPWLYRSLILLVVSCPSAFIVSVPATTFTAITLAARKGIIIKGGIYVEKLSMANVVVFDKTGTLTLGNLKVSEVHPVNSWSEKELLFYAAALEQYSNHPLATAIVAKASNDNLKLEEATVEDVKEIPGQGIKGVVNGKNVFVGSSLLMHSSQINVEAMKDLSGEHKRVMVAVDNEVAGSICVEDMVREDAKVAISELKKHGKRVVLLSGDKKETVEKVAKELGIDEFHGELLPNDKLDMIEKLKEGKGLVVMVGDGINDAPALAAADVGIAMGGTGVDVALESADVVLVRDEMLQIPWLLKTSKRTLHIAKENITISIGTKLLLGILGFIGLIPLWFAVAAGDDGITLALLLNNFRIAK